MPSLPIIRMFRLHTKLMLLGLFLLAIPLLGYQYLLEMKTFLVEGQAQAQLLTAKGIAATLHNHGELFEQLPESPTNYDSLPGYPLRQAIRLDGFDEDWQDITKKIKHFGTANQNNESVPAFSLVLGTRQNYLYGYMEITDSTPIFRHPGFLRLDNSDHLRISFKNSQGAIKRLVMTMEGPGVTSSYYVDKRWLYAEQGQPENRLKGFIRRSNKGYRLEFRLPLSLLGESRQLAILVADVTDPAKRNVSRFAGTFPKTDHPKLSHIIMRSSQLQENLSRFDRSDARIWIFDQHKRVRATVGKIQGNNKAAPSPTYDTLEETETIWPVLLESAWNNFLDFVYRNIVGETVQNFQDFDPRLTQIRDESIIRQALLGQPGSQQRLSLDNKAEILAAAYPIYDEDKVVGAVVIEQSTQSILKIQRQSLQRVASLTLLSLLAVVFVVALFSARLAFRIRRLRRETHEAIDNEGRLLTNQIKHETRSGDEIGDLARSVSEMLEKLHQYQAFIGTIPRTLRHEINNPLNTISTSLEQLSSELNSDQQSTYLSGAQRGLAQINALVEKLAEAASLESSLEDDDKEVIDLTLLLKQYLHYFEQSHNVELNIQLPEKPTSILATDYRIEQLLDKLLENAADFSVDNNPITVNLATDHQTCCLQVINKGPTITADQQATLFDSIHSSRPTQHPTQNHFGLGLYIAKLITSAHEGNIQVENLEDESGVCFSITFPLAKTI